ncbi:sugar transporter [Caldimicrobium thiodismutans]|uniref:Sugar transporter n=1 Tax=Caldimicrobium thiodismutans TaxID=1653476 RepID=A0A0U5BXD2_9BACT|nr:MFS transporter [Caldimicrobium thiodismutans]BAU23365.1 sugar transporter [Caldimicrobium thiodismutans]
MEQERVQFKEVLPVAIVSWTGALLEWLDFYVYAILAKTLAKVYFPSHDPLASLLASFAALAIGFLFRPVGALMFGKIGDQYGRKIAFLTAISMMMVGTIGIALLPGYETLGIFASIGVFILRIIQGLALGGGYGAAITYLGEFTPDHRRGLITGFLFTTPAFGMALAANIASALQGYFGTEAFEATGWRWCFVIAGVVVFVVALIIHYLYKETPVFTALKQIRRVTSAPIKELFTNKHYLWLFILAWIGVIGAHGPIWYTNQLYVSFYLGDLGVDKKLTKDLLAYATYVVLWTYLFFGWVSDKIGRKPILLLGIYGNALIFPLTFYLMQGYANPPDKTMLFLLVAAGTFMNGIGYSGAMSAMLLELFPAKVRTTAIGFTYNMGYGVFGGLTPFMITLLLKITGNHYLSVIIWATIIPMIMGLLYLFKGWETKGERLWEELSAGKFAHKALILAGTMSIGEAMKRLQIEGQRIAIVTDNGTETGRYLGIVEERSLLKALVTGATINTPLKEVVVDVDEVYASARIIDAIVLIQQYGVKGIAVVDQNKRIVGYIDPRYVFNEVALISAGVKKPFTERIRVEEFMTPAITVKDNTPIIEVTKLMVEKNVGFIPVVNADTGKLSGVISEKDLMAILCCEEGNRNKPVIEFMIKNVVTVTPESSLKEALEKFIDNKIRHLPVVRDQRVVGVISVKDALKLV